MFRSRRLVIALAVLGSVWSVASPCVAASTGRDRVEACFAPGTPDWRVQQVSAFVQHEIGLATRFQGLPGTRWTQTATDGGGLGQGDSTVLTWSYIPDGTSIAGGVVPGEPTAPSDMRAWLNSVYGNFNTWHAVFVQVFDRWSELAGLRYVYEPNDDGAAFGSGGAAGQLGVRGDLRIGGHFIDGNSNVLAYNFFPNNGDMVLDSFDSFYNNLSGDSIRMRNVLAHEHGHGLGMSHVCPINQSKLMEPFLTTAFDGPQHDDILGGNRGYGDVDEPNNGMGTATDLGGTGVVLMDRSVDDDTDTDWYEFPGAAGEVITIRVEPIGLSYLNGPQNQNGSCSAGTLFNSLTQSDLSFELRAPNGTTVLANVDDGNAGANEVLLNFSLPSSGSFFVRVAGAQNAAQLYDLSVLGSGTVFADGFESGNTSAWSATVP